MGFSFSNSKKRPFPQMNVTPLVDVVLVLLIIFMVLIPLLNKQLHLQLPKQESSSTEESKNIVVFLSNSSIELNGSPIAKELFKEKLSQIMQNRQDKTVYFDASNDVSYTEMVNIIDLIKQTDVKVVAILTNKIK